MSASTVSPTAPPRGEAFETLYTDHHHWLKGWLLRRLSCTHHAADVAQDTFTNMLEMPELPVLREPRAFLKVVASRLLINRHHRQRVEDEVLRTVAILAEADNARSPEDLSAQRQLLGQVLTLLLQELEGNCGQAFLLARVDGWSYRDIAAELGVSETRVKQYLAKALAHCHARLSQLHD
jgi:RNA polymerase sigma factor (sigma-70 family)